MMMFLDLFPAGVYQLLIVFQEGFWYARSQEVTTGPVFVYLTYARSLGGLVFTIGGLLPLIWFVLSRGFRLRREVEVDDGEWTIYERDWAGQQDSPVLNQTTPAE